MVGPMEVGLVSSMLGITCGIVGVISWAIVEYRKHKAKEKTWTKMIENNLDEERMRLFVDEKEQKKSSKYGTLTLGMVFIGLSLGYFFCNVFHLYGTMEIMVSMAMGCGCGLLAAFFLKRKLEEKDAQKAKEE